MVQQQAALLKPETLIEEFRKNGVTHIVTIPDSETNYLYELMKNPATPRGRTWGEFGSCSPPTVGPSTPTPR